MKLFNKNIFLFFFLISSLMFIGCSLETENELHNYSIEIEGSVMKKLTVGEVAYLWDIDANTLLDRMIEEFDLKNEYTIDSVLDDIRLEYPFSPALIKNMAEEIKYGGLEDE